MAKLLWTQKQDIGPPPRYAHAMVYDAARRRVLLFGGDSLAGHLFNDTWEWDGSDWTQVEDLGPGPRGGHSMAYDSTRNRTVVFGGNSGGADLNDTWEWDGSSWTQLQNAGPGPRAFHGTAFDAARGRVVLFGGQPLSGGAPFQDTWEWDGENWSQLEDSGPAPRSGHAMTYDRVRQRTVLFGGAGTGAAFSDTWEWDGTSWRHVQDVGPRGAVGAAMVFRTKVSTLFGGITTSAGAAPRELFGLTWEWNGAHWTARQDMGVGPRLGHAMAFDSARGRVVLFGGVTVPPESTGAASSLKGDTWEHADVTSPGGNGGGGTVTGMLASVSAAPDPVMRGGSLTVTVTLAGPLNVTVAALVDVLGVRQLMIPPAVLSGSTQFLIPRVLPMPLPASLPIVATGPDGVSVSTTVTVL